MATYTLTADVQSYTLTGVAAGMTAARTLACAVRTYVVTGPPVVLSHTFVRTLTQNFTLDHTDPLEVVRRVAALATDTTNLSLTEQWDQGARLAETLNLTLAQAPATTYGVTLAQAVRAAEVLLQGAYARSASDTINITPTAVVAQAYLMIERLGLSEVLAPATTYALSLSQSMSLQATLVNFFSAVLADSTTMSDVSLQLLKVRPVLTDSVAVTPTASGTLVVRVTASDTASITPTQAVQMLYNPALADGVDIGALYLSPGGGVTTWALNTRTGAVTEYKNYAFNSFARVGRRYVGATSSGLYELTGDTDDGADIVAVLQGAEFQLAGARFSSFKGAYIGMAGSGTIYLKLDAGDGRSYTYQVTAKDDETTKVRFGKGLRARYFTFTLTTAGQDFDLDTIEFLPIRAERRT